MHRLIRIVLFFSLVLTSSGRTAPGGQASASPAKPKPAPTPVPLTTVAAEAQSTMALLQEIDATVSRDQSSTGDIDVSLSNLTSETDARITEDTRLLKSSPT